MASVGIIPNPASGKDIRRVVAQASVISNHEKVNIVSRMLVGLHATGVSKIQIMPDLYGIGFQAVQNLQKQNPELASIVDILDLELSNSPLDSLRAAEIMQKNRVNCIIVLGGDGTTRVVSKGCGDVSLLPVSTGTNNVVPFFVEGTIAGLCAGYFAGLDKSQQHSLCMHSKRIEVWINDELADIALVDLVVNTGGFSGARAIWDSSELKQIAVARAAPTNIGLSAVVGMISPVAVDDEFGGLVYVDGASNNKKTISVPLGPGLIERIQVGDVEKMNPGQAYSIVDERPLVLALDGERELVLNEDDSAFLILRRNGPYIINIDQVMLHAVKSDYFVSE
jgi:predicted polyphosphate/ATP-dependent NAD kinase